mgnify:CR=1 FL=1
MTVLLVILFLQVKGAISNPLFQSIINYGYIGNVLGYLPPYLVGCFCGKFSDDVEISILNLKYVVSLLCVAYILEGMFNGIFYSLSMKMLPLFILFLVPVFPKLDNKRIYHLTFLMYVIHQP